MDNYSVKGAIGSNREATFTVKQQEVSFGITKQQGELSNPAELLLGAFAACCLKNIERFSHILKFDYEHAEIEVVGERQETPTKIVAINYLIKLKSADANTDLLHKNIRKYGTIYNTLKEVCSVTGEIVLVD